MNQSNPPEAPSENLLSRRALIERAELGDLGLALPEAATTAASAESAASRKRGAADSGAALVPLNRVPRMVQEYFVERVRQVEREAEKRRAVLSSKSDAEAYVRDVRAKIQQSFGPWPEKTPLNARLGKKRHGPRWTRALARRHEPAMAPGLFRGGIWRRPFRLHAALPRFSRALHRKGDAVSAEQ